MITTFRERLTTSALRRAGTPVLPSWDVINDTAWAYFAALLRVSDPFESILTMVKTSPYPVALFSVGDMPILSPTCLRVCTMDEIVMTYG